MTKNGKQPVAVKVAIAALVRLAETHGIEAVNSVYAEVIAEVMACRERDVWRVRVTEGQKEMALLEASY